jgi:hypothetical protein
MLREVLHAAFRSVHKLRKFDHISELYHEKGWLTIEQLVKLRAASIVFKARKFGKPKYISQWINDRECERNLRVHSQNSLSRPYARSTTGSRAFSISGPTLWNSLHHTVRDANSFEQFYNRMLTFLSDSSG